MSQFNTPSGGTPGQRNLQPHRGTLVLILGIMGLVFNVCCIPGILAWIFGASDLKQMQAGTMDREGEGLTKAGYIMGIIGTCLVIVGVLIYVVIFVVILGAAAAGGNM
ncbi:MAG: DUF4190 domain-containing protein [Mariniblastus sp.]|nr:DUF4190 domain-containing protein [Mariniblastus sp.]